ncbi:hypothetical protein FRB96_007183 [Tulasnella sp. 330]|nr:hypothetical protein FRB96_007183 [Tulasnella sp. 330]KAG8883279.1 hypothetical protein FRB98_003187 [Tulasnella sp. 332]
MRRKSSASNLLSSFKGPSSGPSSTSGSQTPTTGKDWSDSQSIQSEGSHVLSMSSTSSAPPIIAPGQTSSVEYLREMCRKRISTLQYLKSVHSGQSHWLSTVLITRADLERTFTTNVKKQRLLIIFFLGDLYSTYRWATLGMSLSNLFDITAPQDFLRTLLALMQEYEAVPEDTMKPKMRNLFRGAKLQKKSGGGEFGAYLDADASYLVSPHIPFALDYFQVAFAFFDVLAEVYKRLSSMLGPSSFSPLNAIGPSGYGLVPPAMTPYTAGSNVASVSPGAPAAESHSAYFANLAGGVASGANNDRLSPMGMAGVSGLMPAISISSNHTIQPSPYAHYPGSPPPSTWSPSYGDSLVKIDAKIMRIITAILKKIDETARNRIREELASLNPLLQNLSPGAISAYDYDDR